MGENKRIAKNTGFLYVRMLLVMAVSLYTSRVVLQALGVVDYGIYNVVGGVVAMLSFLNNCAGAATSRYLTFSLGNPDKYDYNKVFSTAFFVHLGIAFFIVLLAETIGLWYVYNKMVIPPDRLNAALWVFHISVLTIFVSFTQVPYNASLISHERMKIYAYVGLYEAFAKLMVAYLLTISPLDKLKLYAVLLFLVTLSLSVFYRWYCVKSFGAKCRIHKATDKKMYKELLSYSGWDLIGNFGGIARAQGVNLILNLFFGPAVNAARAVAYQVESATIHFVNNFLQSVRPVIIKHYAASEIKRMLNLMYGSCRLGMFLFSCLAIPIILESDYILKLWLVNPPAYASIFLKLVLTEYLIVPINRCMIIGIHATGDVKRLNIYGGSKVFIELPLIYILLKLGMGPEMAFIILILGSWLINIVNIWVLKKNIAELSYKEMYVNVILKSLLIILIPTLCAYGISQIKVLYPFVRLILVCVVYWVTLVPMAYKFALSREMKVRIRNIIRTKLPFRK